MRRPRSDPLGRARPSAASSPQALSQGVSPSAGALFATTSSQRHRTAPAIGKRADIACLLQGVNHEREASHLCGPRDAHGLAVEGLDRGLARRDIPPAEEISCPRPRNEPRAPFRAHVLLDWKRRLADREHLKEGLKARLRRTAHSCCASCPLPERPFGLRVEIDCFPRSEVSVILCLDRALSTRLL